MATLISETDEFHYYRYRIKELYILFSDENYEVEKNKLQSIVLIEDYMENLYPIFKITLTMERSLYDRIIKEKDTLKIKANIQKYYRINDKTKKSVYSTYINDTFQLILDDDDDDLAKDAHEKEFPDGDENELNAVIISMELFLFKKETIKSNKTVINRIFEKCTITNALMYLFTRLKLSKNVLMDKADNTTKYDELRLPPLTINDEFRYLDSYYGIHKHGTVIYFGLSRSYVLRFSSKTNAYESKEIQDVCFILPKVGSAITDTYSMVYKKSDTTKYYMTVDPDQFKPVTADTSESVINAEDIEVVSASDGEVTQQTDDTENKKIIIAHGVNPYYATMYKNFVKSNESAIQIFVKDVDLSVLEPNKHYSFLFEDTALAKKYKGKYFLCSKEIVITKEGKEFIGGATLTLRKFS